MKTRVITYVIDLYKYRFILVILPKIRSFNRNIVSKSYEYCIIPLQYL